MNNKISPEEDWSAFDLNWYFADRYMRMIAVASGGGQLPDFIQESLDSNDRIHRQIVESDALFESVRNPLIQEYIDFSEVETEEYFSTFDQLARIGFFAFDKVNLSDPTNDQYVLVSYPKWPRTRNGDRKLPLLHFMLALSERTNSQLSYRSALKTLPVLDVNLFNNRPPFFPVGDKYTLPTTLVKTVSNRAKLFGS